MAKHKLKQGLVQVYTGDGKGKTTAALGLAWRAMGRDLRVGLVQFLKGDIKTGEMLAAECFREKLTYVPPVRVPAGQRRKSTPERPWWLQPPTEGERTAARKTLETARAMINSGDYDLVVCDEICVACYMELLNEDDLLKLIREKPAYVELILTGRHAPEGVLAAADLVTDMRMVKHPFAKEIGARKGIEF
jgi:cob(I)alamin adenosyltransferase